MGPSGADVMFLAIITVFIGVVMWFLWRESRVRELRYAVAVFAVAILSMLYYSVIAPYYVVVPSGETVEYVVPTNVTVTVNGTTSVVAENATVVSPKYIVNVAPYSYFMVILALVIILVLIGMYFIFKWATRYSWI